MGEPLYEYLVELKAEGKDAVKGALVELKVSLEQLDGGARAFAEECRRAFAEARDGALAGTRGSAELRAAAADLARQQEGLLKLWAEGKITAKQYWEGTALATRAATGEIKEASKAQSAVADASRKAAESHRVLAGAFAFSSGALLGWVRAGMQGTAEGELLAAQMQQISREVANAFAPAIRKVVEYATELAARFRSLSGAQQDQIARWAAVGLAAMGVVAVLPRLVAGIEAVSVALKVLAFSNPFTAALAVITAVMVATEEGREAFKELFEALKPIGAAVVEIFKPLSGVLAEIARAVAGVLGPAFKVLGKIIEGVLAPLQIVARGLGGGARATFGTEQGGRQLRELGGDERGAEIRRREEEIAFLRDRASLEEVGRFRRTQEGSVLGIPTGGGAGSIMSARESEGQRAAVVRDLRAELDRQRDEANRAGRGHHALTPRGGGMEDVRAVWSRLQTAVNRVSPELEEARRQTNLLGRIAAASEGRGAAPPPAPGGAAA